MTNEEIDALMKTVRTDHKYTWGIFKNTMNLYTSEEITEEEWNAWLVRNPRVVFTSKDTGIDESVIGGGFIPIRRERPKR